MDTVIEGRAVVKKYNNKKVVDGVQFQIFSGECFGILGPNGAGKSTTMRMMYCSSPLTSGELFVKGLNVRENAVKIKKSIGVVPQENGLDPDFTVLDNLLIFSRYQRMSRKRAKSRVRDLLRFMHLEDYQDFRADELSGGLKRRLAIARAIMNDPDILFLDEPTTGLDLQARLWIWDALRKMKKKGISIVLTTPSMEEAQNLCDRIVVMDNGRFLNEGSPQELIESHIGCEVVEFEVNLGEIDYHINKIKKNFKFQVLNNRIKVFITKDQDRRRAMDLTSGDNIIVRKATLEDVFLKLSGHELKE